MRPTISLTIVAALVLVLCQEMADQAVAKVVRTGRSVPSNPAVEEGGLHLVPGPPPPIPYSLIGALALDNQVVGRCGFWSPWALFGPSPFRQPGLFGPFPFRQPGLFGPLPFRQPFRQFATVPRINVLRPLVPRVSRPLR
jgi:hypothetical protein